MLRISEGQAGELAYDTVRRHARTQAQRTELRLAGAATAADEDPEADRRLRALAGVLRDDVAAKAGRAAPHLVIDLDLCAGQFAAALRVGAVYRETAVSGQLLASAALGLRWLADERLCGGAEGRWETPEPLPDTPQALKDWAEAGWTDRFEFARQRSQGLIEPAQYALRRALQTGFSPATLRSIASAVFDPADEPRLTRFVTEERALLAEAGLARTSLADRRIEVLCIGADLVYGLGRFVRLAVAVRPSMARIDRLHDHLLKAVDELAG